MLIWLETQNEREVCTVEENVFKQLMVGNFPILKADRHPQIQRLSKFQTGKQKDIHVNTHCKAILGNVKPKLLKGSETKTGMKDEKEKKGIEIGK